MNAATATPTAADRAEGKPATRSRTRTPVLDTVCADAVDLALAAAEQVAGVGEVGRHVGMIAEGDRVVTHLFECKDLGYRGWNWAVTVTRAPRTKFVTLDETVLVSGEDSVLPPEWVPWSERLRPGDLGPGDLLPIAEDDARLVPAYTAADEQEPKPYPEISRDSLPLVGFQLGLGRARVLSREGREEAAERWHEGDFGPHSPMAQAAPDRCAGCGFLAPLAGMLGQAFGVCANEIAPSDGRVVSLDYGCGAHSEAAIVPATHPTSEPVVDEYTYDTVSFGERVVPAADDAAAAAAAQVAEAIPVAEVLAPAGAGADAVETAETAETVATAETTAAEGGTDGNTVEAAAVQVEAAVEAVAELADAAEHAAAAPVEAGTVEAEPAAAEPVQTDRELADGVQEVPPTDD